MNTNFGCCSTSGYYERLNACAKFTVLALATHGMKEVRSNGADTVPSDAKREHCSQITGTGGRLTLNSNRSDLKSFVRRYLGILNTTPEIG